MAKLKAEVASRRRGNLKSFSVLMVLVLVVALGAAIVPASPVEANGALPNPTFITRDNTGASPATNISIGWGQGAIHQSGTDAIHVTTTAPTTDYAMVGVPTDFVLTENTKISYWGYTVTGSDVKAPDEIWLEFADGTVICNHNTVTSPAGTWEQWTLSGSANWFIPVPPPDSCLAVDIADYYGWTVVKVFLGVGWPSHTTGATADVYLDNLSIDADGDGTAEYILDDDTGTIEVLCGTLCGITGCTSIQDGIDAALPDDTINVATGTYGEQLLIDAKNLTIQAASTPVITGAANAEYIIKVTNADVTLDGLTVNGTGNNIKYGIWYYDGGSGTTSGTITNCTVENIERVDGSQANIRIDNSPVDITNNTIREFYKNGVFVKSAGSTGTISGNEIICRIIDNVNEVQYGVQVGWGADVTIQNNTIYDSTIASVDVYDWNWASSGVYVVDAGATTGSRAHIINNHIHHCMEGVHIGFQAVSGDTSYGLIQDNNIHDCFWCVGVVGDASADIENNTIKMLDADVIAFVAGYGEGIFVGGSWTAIHEYPTATIANNTINNFDMGIDIYEFADVTITGNDITNNDYGIYTNAKASEGWAQTVVAHCNNIVGNSDYGVDNSANSATFDATNNWWGANDGPSGVGPGSGDAVSTNVDYTPWTTRTGGTESATGSGTVSFGSTAGGLKNVNAVAEGTLPTAGKPARVDFPHGLFSFDICCLNPGATITVTITLPSAMPVGTQYWKCQNGTWVDCTSLLGDDDGDNILTLTLTDGGLGDADGLADGKIADPGGPAVARPPAPAPVPPTPAPPPSLDGSTGGPSPSRLTSPELKLKYLNINPQQASANQPVTISTNVVNRGGMAGSTNVILKINGQVEESRMVSVSPGAAHPVKFTVYRSQPGTYNVNIGGQKGSFAIVGASSVASSQSVPLMAFFIAAIIVLVGIVLLIAFRRPARDSR